MAKVKKVVEVAEVAEVAEVTKPISGGYIKPEILNKRGKFVITAIQNNTNQHNEFWDLLKAYAHDNNCEIITCPILYNKNAWSQPDDVESGECWFFTEGKKYLHNQQILLNDNVLLMAGSHVLPTALNPLNGFQALGVDGYTVVIPATKISLEVSARLKGEQGKTYISTGASTQSNHVARKAGMVADTMHQLGFVIVEEGKQCRIVEYVNGGFYDFDPTSTDDVKRYGNIPANPAPFIVLGDIHAEKCDVSRINAMRGIIFRLNPVGIVLQDLCDFSNRNHHNIDDVFHKFSSDMRGNNVREDIAKARRFVKNIRLDNNTQIFIADSNHDRACDKWLLSDWRDDQLNAEYYLRLSLAKIKAIKKGEYFNAFEHAFNLPGKLDNVTFGRTDESYMKNDCEVSVHGDRGPNGSRGSIAAFRKLGKSMVIGHSHSPGLSGKVAQTGCGGNLDMGYNVGPSSWRHAHVVVFANGQKQMIFE